MGPRSGKGAAEAVRVASAFNPNPADACSHSLRRIRMQRILSCRTVRCYMPNGIAGGHNRGLGIRLFFWFLLALWLSGCLANPPQQSSATGVASIRTVSAARAEAFRQGDAAGIAVHFTEDGLLMAPGSPAQRGREAVRAYYQSIFNV